MKRIILALIVTFSIIASGRAETPIDENHVLLADKVVRVGENVAYYDENGVLQVSRPVFIKDGEVFKCETTKLKMYVAANPDDNPWPCRIESRGKVLKIRIDGLGYYSSGADLFRKLHSPQYPASGTQNGPHFVQFDQVFPSANLYYPVGCANCWPMLAFSTLANFEPPQPAEDYLGISMEVDLQSLPGYRIAVSREANVVDYYTGSNLAGLNVDPEHICSSLVSGNTTLSRRITLDLPQEAGNFQRYFLFDDDKVFDRRPFDEIEENGVYPLKLFKKLDGRDYIFLLVPISWLQNEARFPVLLPFSVGSDTTSNVDETFLPSYTYVVDGKYFVKSLSSLGTSGEPVFVKYLPGFDCRICITKKGGAGVKIDHTIFTSIFDTNPLHGPILDTSLFGFTPRSPAPGNYGRALDAIKGSGSFIRNSQFYYADRAITNSSPTAPDDNQEIVNVLIDNCRDAGAKLRQWGTFSHNTIRRCGKGIEAAAPVGQVSHCVFAQNRVYGVNQLPTGSTDNMWYANNRHAETGSLGACSCSEVNGLTDPFITGPGGDSYLRSDLVDNENKQIDLSQTGFKYGF